MGKCLKNLAVEEGESRDVNEKPRFFPVNPNKILSPGKADWETWGRPVYMTQNGENCCSEDTISFHYVEPEQMYTLEFLIYKMRIFGRSRQSGTKNDLKRINKLI